MRICIYDSSALPGRYEPGLRGMKAVRHLPYIIPAPPACYPQCNPHIRISHHIAVLEGVPAQTEPAYDTGGCIPGQCYFHIRGFILLILRKAVRSLGPGIGVAGKECSLAVLQDRKIN